MQHLIDGHAQRVGIAENDHAERVADEDDVGAGGIGDLRRGEIVRGEHADALHALHRLHRGDGHSFGICHFASSWAEEGGVAAAFRPPSAG